MNFRPSRRNEDPHELPMTSFIDVVFLLLIFFMLTASFVRENELRAALMTDNASPATASPLTPQFVTVDSDGAGGSSFRLGRRPVQNQSELTDILRVLPKEAGLIVRGLPEAPVGGVAAAVQAATDAGFAKVSYVPAGS